MGKSRLIRVIVIVAVRSELLLGESGQYKSSFEFFTKLEAAHIHESNHCTNFIRASLRYLIYIRETKRYKTVIEAPPISNMNQVENDHSPVRSTEKSSKAIHIYEPVVEPELLKTILSENVYIFSGQVAILCQFANPALAKGSYKHSNFGARIPNRLTNTIRFMTAAVYGNQEEKELVFGIIHRYHARVKGDDYDAKDPELHKWTAATLFAAFVFVHEAFFGELPRDQQEILYKEYAIFGTSLSMPTEMWPATLDDFWDYWNYNIDNLEVSDMARKLSRDLLYPSSQLPLWMRISGPLARVVTTNLIPKRLAIEYGLEPTLLSRLQFQLTTNTIGFSYPNLPLYIRQSMHRVAIDDLKKATVRIKKSGHWS